MLVWVKLVYFPLNFIMLMRTVNIMCISKKKIYYISIFTTLLKLLREIQKDHVQWVLIPIQSIPRRGVRLTFDGCGKGDKASEFLIFFFFWERHKLMAPWVVFWFFSKLPKILKIGIFKCCSSWTSYFFSQFMKEMENHNLWILGYALLPNLSQVTRIGKLGFLNFPYFHIFSDCEENLSGMVCV